VNDLIQEIADLRRQNELLKQRLDQTQALAAIGELTSTATHEFNNVLMTILNYAKLGLRHQDAATRDKALRKILEGAERAAKISRVILGNARNRRSELVPTDLASLVRDVLVLLERELSQARIAVELRLDDVPPILGDGNQLQRVLINLLINARQAMPQGGSVFLGLLHEPDVQQVLLTVRDTGVGISSENLPRIFDPFFTTKTGPDQSGRGGTGLGLSACREIIVAHGGRIRVESTVGRGTAFLIRFPTDNQATQAA
jgi:signal transduction histidine kinase